MGILSNYEGCEEINMILSIVRWEIWKSRCKNQYDNVLDKHSNLVNTVLASIKSHIKILLNTKRLKCRETINELQAVFRDVSIFSRSGLALSGRQAYS